MLRVILLCAAAAGAYAQVRSGIDLEYGRIVNDLWDAVRKDADGFVNQTFLDDFYKRYDNKDSEPAELNVYENDYKGGLRSVTDDFRISVRNAAAYFKLQDLVDFYDEDPDYFCRLTTEDNYVAILYGDDDFDGKLDETEFKFTYNRIYRGASSALLFIDTRSIEGSTLYDDQINKEEWDALFTRIAGSEERKEFYTNDFRSFWINNGYGGAAQAEDIFRNILDIERSGSIQPYEWDIVYLYFDFDGDGKLAVEEFLMIDYLLNEGAPLGETLIKNTYVPTKVERINRLLADKQQ